VDALPKAAYVVLLEAALGGVVALMWLALFEKVPRSFVRFTGACLLVLGLLGVWLRIALLDDVAGALSLATLAGAAALGTSLVALSLGHWYLVSPKMAVRPLVRITLALLAALLVQAALVALALVSLQGNNYLLFLAVRVVFGIVVPLLATVMAWRTARIRSLDSATGLLYIVVALVLAGELSARSLFFLTGAAL
jgi:hypothetical protein